MGDGPAGDRRGGASTARSVEDLYALAPIQEGLLFHTLQQPAAGAYIWQAVCTFESAAAAAAFEHAWNAVAVRHPILRTIFSWEGRDEPVQIVLEPAPLPALRLDWTTAGDDAGARLARHLEEERRQGFELDRVPPLRLTFMALPGDRWYGVVSAHHLLIDGWSTALLFAEVAALHRAALRDEPPELPPPPTPFRAYVVWARSQDLAEAEQHWRRHLGDVTHPTRLPIQLGPPTLRPSTDVVTVGIQLTEQATQALMTMARRSRVTLNTVVQGAYALLLSRYASTGTVVFGTVVSGRSADVDGVESMVGPLINTLPLRVDVAGEMQLVPWLQRLQDDAVTAREFEHVSLARIQRWSGVPSGTPLFDTILSFQSYPISDAAATLFREADATAVESGHYPLTLRAIPGAGLHLTAAYDRTRFEAAAVDRLLEHWRHLLEEMSENPERRLSELRLLRDEERQHVLEMSRGPRPAVAEQRCVHERFEEQAERTPEAVAVVCGEEQVSYAELEARANRLAQHLRSLGVGAETLVGVCLERSVELVVGLLGILKAGGAYVPLDAGYPKQRLGFLLEDTGAALLLTEERMRERLPEYGGRVVWVDGEAEEISRQPSSRVESVVGVGNLAYVIYTSGSTGTPKGVEVEHGSVSRLLTVTEERFGFGEADVWTQFHSYAFDFSVWEMWGALAYGGRLVLVPREVARAPEEFAELLTREGVTVLNQTPSMFRQMVVLVEEGRWEPAESLRVVVFGGEALDVESVRRWYGARGEERPRLVNMYGITETTVHVTYCELDAGVVQGCDAGATPIGRPLDDLDLYTLDEGMEPQPVGVPGEMYVGGAGVARGYLRRPELTAERFVENPFGQGRLYRTGDLARYRRDGSVDYLGRVDDQVKIRGYRIELGEVEATLRGCEGVRDAVVVVREVEGDRGLVGYVVPGEGFGGVAWLRGALRERLPEYMVPRWLVELEAVPLTANGKVDRRALPEPDGPVDQGEYTAPRTEMERRLVEIWSEVLRVERVGVHDNFFELGGHSLLAMRLVSRMQAALHRPVPLSALFDEPTISGLVPLIGEAPARVPSSGSAPPESASGPDRIAVGHPRKDVLLSGRERGLLAGLWRDGRALWDANIPVHRRLVGPLDLAALQRSLDDVLARHEALRVSYRRTEDGFRRVTAAPGHLDLPVVDLGRHAARDRFNRACQMAAQEVAQPFDLCAGPLIRARLLRLDRHDHVLLLTLSHMVNDGWSIAVLDRDLATLYNAHATGTPATLPALPLQYHDYVAWRCDDAGGEFAAQTSYWERTMAGRPEPPALPADRPWRRHTNRRAGELRFEIPAPRVESLSAMCRDGGVTLFMACLAALNLLVTRYADVEEVVVCTTTANRQHSELFDLMGGFFTTIGLRTDLSGDPTVADLLQRVRATALEGFANQGVEFNYAPAGSGGWLERASRLYIAYEDPGVDRTLHEAPPLHRLTVTDIPLPRLLTSGVDLQLSIEHTAEGALLFALTYLLDLFEVELVQRMANHLTVLLESLPAHLRTPISELPMVTEADLRPLQARRGSGDDTGDTVVRQLERTMTASAKRVAVSSRRRSLTYGELDTASRRMAANLRRRGVGPGVLVGLSVRDLADLAIGVVGVLRAGAGFVVAQPAETRGLETLCGHDVPLVVTDGESPQSPSGAVATPLVALLATTGDGATPQHRGDRDGPAYVLRFSDEALGPVAVTVPHGTLLRLLRGPLGRQVRPADVVAQSAPRSSEEFVFELLATLTRGARLVAVRDDTGMAPAVVVEMMRRERVTVVVLPPAIRDRLGPTCAALLSQARLVLLTGAGGLPVEIARLALGELGARLCRVHGPTPGPTLTWAYVVEHPVAPSGVGVVGEASTTLPWILDGRGQPLPIGLPGQLHLATGGARTSSFARDVIAHPLGDGTELFVTGRYARLREDGSVQLLDVVMDDGGAPAGTSARSTEAWFALR